MVKLPVEGFRWMTFFSHPADKGSGIMLEYNERAAVSRLLIPAFLDDSKSIECLPETISLDEMAELHPDVFDECRRAFPALVSERRFGQLKLRDRARHHAGEVERVSRAVKILLESQDPENAMLQLGHLINETHISLRDLYGVSTPEVERLIEVILADDQVYGARLMGGGFGGNVLALTAAENVTNLVDRVQSEYYAPQNRDGIAEASIMISTPGDGLCVTEP